jgi:hypothetical protein
MDRDDVQYALGRAERLCDLLRLALDTAESDDARRIALEHADEEVGILGARPLSPADPAP